MDCDGRLWAFGGSGIRPDGLEEGLNGIEVSITSYMGDTLRRGVVKMRRAVKRRIAGFILMDVPRSLEGKSVQSGNHSLFSEG